MLYINNELAVVTVPNLLAWYLDVVGVVWGAFLGGLDESYAQGGVERACLGVLAPQAAGAGKEEKRRREGEGGGEGVGGG